MKHKIKNRLKDEITPLIDGNSATFVWVGDEAPTLSGDFTGWDEGKPIILTEAEPGIWTYKRNFPADAYVEYGYFQDDERVLDPFNPRRSSNGMGEYNQILTMPDYKPSTLARSKKHVPHGAIVRYKVSTENLIIGEERMVHLYQPPIDKPAPLLIVFDGLEYFKRLHLNIIIDNLIANGRIHPVALAFIENGGNEARTLEYACSEATLLFLLAKVLPLASKHLDLVDINTSPGAYGVIGASMGGLIALYTAARMPQVFGNVLSQSGAFSLGGFDLVVFDLLRLEKNPSLKIWLDVGIYDHPSLLDSNRRMNDLLTNIDYHHEYHEYNAGHNFPAWRDDIWQGLEFLFGK